jgi:hypothetical protein
MRQHIVGCVYVLFSAGRYVVDYMPPDIELHAHTLRYAAALPKIWLPTILIHDFNKEHTSSLRMI